MPRNLTMTEINALTRNISRAITALEDDGRLTELLEMYHFLTAAIKSLRDAKKEVGANA